MPVRRISVLLGVVVLLGGCNPFATKGTVPPPPPGGGVVDPQQFPDFISALDRAGNPAGYVPKSCLFPTAATGPGQDESCPVFADDLITLVGHMVPGRGFVPLGVDPGDVPPFPVQAGPSAGP
jgi:hypothetical protein